MPPPPQVWEGGCYLSVSKINSQHQRSSVILSEIRFKGGDHAEEVLSAVRDGKDGACVAAGAGGALTPRRAAVLLPKKEGETNDTPAAYHTPLRQCADRRP